MIELSWVAIGIALLACGLAVTLFVRQTKSQQNASQQMFELERKLVRDNSILRHEIDEVRSGSIGIGKKLKEIQQWLVEMDEKQAELSLQDPESKLYTRAAKMAAKGATALEIAEDCEIPIVEAELIVSLRKHS